MQIKIIKSNRKTISLSIDDELNTVVRAPFTASQRQINETVEKNKDWLEKARSRKIAYLNSVNVSDETLSRLKKEAKDIIPKRVEYYSNLMNLYPTGVKVTAAKKRLGSCSGKNSICFSCFLINYPIEAIDYVVVHELAHIKYHDHSKNFYELIKRYMPDYKERIKQLKK